MARITSLFWIGILVALGGRAPLPAATPGVDIVAPAALTSEQLLQSLTRDVAAHFNLEGDFQMELLRPWTAPTRLASEWTVSVTEYPAVVSSSMLFRVSVLADRAPAAECTLLLRASLWRDAWTTRQPIAMGTTFDPAMLETRRVDALRERDILPASAGDGSFIFSRGIGGGRTLTWRDIARRPLVKKGELVEVSASSGSLLVTMKALAMENGARGETISVRNPESQKNFAAIVVDEKRVQVRF